MPIPITPTPITALVPQTVQADQLHIDKLTIDATGEVQTGRTPIMELIGRFYAEDANTKARTYDSSTSTIRTNNVYAVAEKIPEVAAAELAIYTAVAAIRTYLAARKADVDTTEAAQATAQTAKDTAATNQATAQAAADAATSARDAAQKALIDLQGTPNVDPAVLASAQSNLATATDAATAAAAALQTAKDATAAATAALDTAIANATTARLALADPANPQLVIAS